MADEWQVVSRRGRNRLGGRRAGSSSSKLHDKHTGNASSLPDSKRSQAVHEEAVEPVPEVSNDKQQSIARRVRAIADVLRESSLVEDALQVITEHFGSKRGTVQGGSSEEAEDKSGALPALVGYGLGSFCASSNAVHQLGFLVALKEALMGVSEDEATTVGVELFDPAMNKSDAAIAEHFQLSVIQENEHGRRRVEGDTVFFMPHCGKALYQNVLACNWGLQMQHLVIIGNSFSAYGDRVLDAKARQQLVLVDVLPYLAEVPLSCGVSKTHDDFARYEAAFNDLSVHSFPTHLIEQALRDSKLADKMTALTNATFDKDIK